MPRFKVSPQTRKHPGVSEEEEELLQGVWAAKGHVRGCAARACSLVLPVRSKPSVDPSRLPLGAM